MKCWSIQIGTKKKVFFFKHFLWFFFLLEIFSTLLTLLCLNCLFHMNNHIYKVVYVMFVEIFSRWNLISENIRKKAPHFFWFQVGYLKTSQIFYKIQNYKWWLVFFSSNHWLDLYLPKFLALALWNLAFWCVGWGQTVYLRGPTSIRLFVYT